MLDAGWKLPLPHHFVHPTAGPASTTTQTSRRELLQLIAATINQLEWESATEGHLGSGLQLGGPMLEPVKAKIRKLTAGGGKTEATVLCKIASGGFMTRQRLHSYRPQQCDGLCPHCEEPEDDHHLYWGCRRHRDRLIPEIRDSEHLRLQADEEQSTCAAFWSRGLFPAELWPIPNAAVHYEPQLFSIGEGWLGFVGVVCTDGSGGKRSPEPRLRRAGWACVQVGSVLLPRSWPAIAAPLGGEQQSVPRAELSAVLATLQHAAGPLDIWTDHENIPKIWRRGKAAIQEAARTSDNSDLWDQIYNAICGSPFHHEVFWVNSHVKSATDVLAHIPVSIYVGNAEADRRAGDAAKMHEVTDWDADNYKQTAGKIELVLNRLIFIGTEATKERPRFDDSSLVRLSRASQAQQLHAAARGSSHKLRRVGGSKGIYYHCAACLARSGPSFSAKKLFLQTACGDQALRRPHVTHSLRAQGSTVWCTCCGAWSTRRYESLVQPCPGKPKSGVQRHALRHLEERGLRPAGA